MSIERLGSDKFAEAVLYDDFEVYTYDSLEFNYDTTKLVAGYTCYLATYQLFEMKYEVWYTEELSLGVNILHIPDEIPGTPMEFTHMIDIADIRYTANAFDSTAPNPNRFRMEVPPGFSLDSESPFPLYEPPMMELEMIDELTTPTDGNGNEIPPPPPPIRIKERD